MQPEQLRIALFSGNYNYVRDGANQALNRLVDYLLRQGAAVRIYSPTVAEPAFKAVGDVVSVPASAIPRRPEYRLPLRIPLSVRRDMAEFAPNVIHVASPDIVSHRAISWARGRGIPIVASVHTRFETYLEYYRLQWLEPTVRGILRRFYRRCDAIDAALANQVRLRVLVIGEGPARSWFAERLPGAVFTGELTGENSTGVMHQLIGHDSSWRQIVAG